MNTLHNNCIITDCNNKVNFMGYCDYHIDLSQPILVRQTNNICLRCNNHTSINTHSNCYIHSETSNEFLYHINNPQILKLIEKYPEITWIKNFINFINNN